MWRNNTGMTMVWFFIINLIFSLIIILLERKSPEKTIAWLLVFIFMPPLGFILYLFLGRNWKKHKLNNAFSPYVKKLIYRVINIPRTREYVPLVKLIEANSNSPLFINNDIKVFKNGDEKFKFLKEELNKAKHHIHLEYYIVKSDNIGNEIKDILIKKAKEGVKIRFIMDRVGSIKINKNYIHDLKAAGADVVQYSYFLAPLLRKINTQINYRNHRKIAIIDGKVGFVGGMNIGDEYLGHGSLGFWRDTHIMVKGDFVQGLQGVFMDDFMAIKRVNEGYFAYNEDIEMYFPKVSTVGNRVMQLVTSAPNSEHPAIMQTVVKMISLAKHSIYITTPYFVPPVEVMDALKIASLGGVDIKILFPGTYDHIMVYHASRAYLYELIKCGIKVYLYDKKAFIHSKVMTIDGTIATVGTANMDIRSYELNYEVNAVIYDNEVTYELEEMFKADLEVSNELTRSDYENISKTNIFFDFCAKIFSALL